jgi:hypothetical protein
MTRKPEVGQIWEYTIRPKEYWLITKIDNKEKECKIVKFALRNVYTPHAYAADLFARDFWRYISNNIKIIEILYGKA